MPNRLSNNTPRAHGLGVLRDAKPQHFDRTPSSGPSRPAGGWGPIGASPIDIINSGPKRVAISNTLAKAFGGANVVSHPPLPTFHVMQKNAEPVTMRVDDKKLTMTRGDVSVHVSVPKKATQAAVNKAVQQLAAKFQAAEAD